MYRSLILASLAAVTLSSYAAKRMTVVQLEQTVTSATTAHKTDIQIAEQIGRIELSERISAHTLERLNSVAKGPRTALALQLLTDVSAFLPLPANELPNIPSPDQPMQQRQLEMTHKYAFSTLPRLPNLLATRTTYSFDDSPQEQEKGAWLDRAGLHLVGTSKAETSVLSERENPPVKASASLPTQNGLVTWGEFGSILLMILNDSAKGTTTWSHWEQVSTGPASVFDYSVPKSASHYEIATPVFEDVERGGGSSRWSASGGFSSTIFKSKVLRTTPAYHGSLWIDPSSGTILRASVIADLKGNQTLELGAILVEYGPVRIKDQTLICPLRSLALSRAPGSVSATLQGSATEWLNENLFTDYHLFASTSRILTERADASEPESPVRAADSNAGGPAQAEPAVAPSSEPPREQASVGNTPTVTLQTPLPAPETPPHEPSISIAPNSPANTGSSQPAASGGLAPTLQQPARETPSSSQDGTATRFRLNVNAVLVPVVVRDRHGSVVDDLQKLDFKVLDNGLPRPLSGFLVERRGSLPMERKSPVEGSAAPIAVAPQMSLPGRITVFVFDDLDMGFEEIADTQTAATKSFDGALTGSDMAAVVSTSGKINSGLTRDRAKLVDAIKALRPVELYHPDSAACPKISYYQADLIVNKHDENALHDVTSQITTVCAPGTPANLARARAESAAKSACVLGQQGVRATYAAISEYVRRMAKLPGQHSMILVSSGFLPIEEEARYEESKLMNLAADSNVAINALDASGLYATFPTASQDLRNRSPSEVGAYREREMRAAENAMGELAYATGGDFFHNNNDFEAGFTELLKAPETVYVLELAIGGVKANGAYHQLKVSVDRADVQVQARRGYLAPSD